MVADTRRESRNETLQINRQARQARQGGNVVSRNHFWVGSVVAPTHRSNSEAAAGEMITTPNLGVLGI